jgi:hypothetical protein
MRQAAVEVPMNALADTLSVLQDLLPSKCPRASSALAMQPKWFQSMVTGAAIAEIEGTYGFRVSQSLRLFYRFPAYAVFLRSHHDINVFLDNWIGQLPSSPIWTRSCYPPWLAIAEEPVSGYFLMVQLDHPCPQIAWRYFHTLKECDLFPETFDAWLLQGALNTVETYRGDGNCRLCANHNDSPGA